METKFDLENIKKSLIRGLEFAQRNVFYGLLKDEDGYRDYDSEYGVAGKDWSTNYYSFVWRVVRYIEDFIDNGNLDKCINIDQVRDKILASFSLPIQVMDIFLKVHKDNCGSMLLKKAQEDLDKGIVQEYSEGQWFQLYSKGTKLTQKIVTHEILKDIAWRIVYESEQSRSRLLMLFVEKLEKKIGYRSIRTYERAKKFWGQKREVEFNLEKIKRLLSSGLKARWYFDNTHNHDYGEVGKDRSNNYYFFLGDVVKFIDIKIKNRTLNGCTKVGQIRDVVLPLFEVPISDMGEYLQSKGEVENIVNFFQKAKEDYDKGIIKRYYCGKWIPIYPLEIELTQKAIIKQIIKELADYIEASSEHKRDRLGMLFVEMLEKRIGYRSIRGYENDDKYWTQE